MRHSNQWQVMLISECFLKTLRHEQLANWLQTRAQSLIRWQQQMGKKTFLQTLDDTTTIYMS